MDLKIFLKKISGHLGTAFVADNVSCQKVSASL